MKNKLKSTSRMQVKLYTNRRFLQNTGAFQNYIKYKRNLLLLNQNVWQPLAETLEIFPWDKTQKSQISSEKYYCVLRNVYQALLKLHQMKKKEHQLNRKKYFLKGNLYSLFESTYRYIWRFAYIIYSDTYVCMDYLRWK